MKYKTKNQIFFRHTMMRPVYHVDKKFLSKGICEAIIKGTLDQQFGKGHLLDGEQAILNLSVRKVLASFLSEDFLDVQHRMTDRMIELNSEIWKFRKLRDVRTVTHLRYLEGHFFKWHFDTGYGKPSDADSRVLTGIILLSDPKTYLGAELQIQDWNEEVQNVPLLNQGDLVVFPSCYRHQVKQLTAGVRDSLVMWLHSKAI